MQRLSTVMLVLFAVSVFAACNSSKKEQSSTPDQAAEQAEQAPAEQAPPTTEAPATAGRPPAAQELEKRFRDEAREKITADNVDEIIAELEKEIEAELAELEN
jgi:flagellar motility protein MotE (MotC chaperone)